MGTPHRGTGSIESQGVLRAAVASNNTIVRTDGTILRALRSSDDTLMDVVSELTQLCNLSALAVPILCFYEQRSTLVEIFWRYGARGSIPIIILAKSIS